ncbi:sensor histidine kinase [Ktedonobacter racemifer]|uniref:histidine kinase n=1 Tax=Ktedonobacter racemifer DSM 44963 TaxID=485913 RepID=D6TG12_KTERA|nr:HAMP domain-containing sensor histidine kinase [Ktedonobacter racemifer]EFH88714.1 integral membrane sensor signal transduction histidine kinase [Ktedonobacter racemifer DSM 44963]
MSTRTRLAHWFGLIRTRLTLWIITILAVGLLVFIGTTLIIARQLLNNFGEKRLQQSVSSLSVALAQEPGLSPTLVQSQLNAFSSSEIFLQYQDRQGKPIASSTNLGRKVFPLAPLRPAIAAGRFASLTIDRTPFLLYGQAIVVKGQVQGYIIAASASAGDSESWIFTLMYSGVCVMLTLVAVLVWLLVRRTLRPLEQLAESASHIAQTRDHALRVQMQGRPDEINSLARTINGMLHALEEAYQHVQQVNDLQRRFLADASHELRTPLTIMLSSLELMKKEEGRDPEFQTNALENISTEAERMARLTTRLLLLARTDARAPFAPQPLLIVDIISEAYRQGCPSHRKIAMQCQGLETLEDAVVSGNADYLKQVFLILLENACKYTPDGGQVTIIGERKERELVVTVADTGIGIAQDDVPRLFERFYRAPNASIQPGMGLGLSIALSIVEQHNGTIKVESTLGQGSRFTISLPLLNE